MEWDKYFFEIASVVALNSKCLSRQIGGLLVEDNRILCTGYNGPPSGIDPCGTRYYKDRALINELDKRNFNTNEVKRICPRYTLGYKSGEGLEWCVAGHTERNLLITAARFGISTKGKSMYLTCGIPCKDCLIEIINAGIKEVIVTGREYYDKMSGYLIEHSSVVVRQYQFMKGE